MRHELSIDNRNEPKWSVTINAANRANASAVIYAAMFFQDVGEHGNETNPWPHAQQVLEDVQKFFSAERRLCEGGQERNLWCITNLDPRIMPVKKPYLWDRQEDYVKSVLDAANRNRIAGRNLVVLLDPCNGIAATRHRHHPHFRISPTSVNALWSGLHPGDILIIWQWPQPNRIPANNPVNLLLNAIRTTGSPDPVGGVITHPFGCFVMLELKR
jgi:hypothetical protein